MRRLLPLLLVLLTGVTLCAQSRYAAPLRTPLRVTGTFGELRSDHYHAGLDFRGSTGTPVYAVADGFVSRIKVSGGGYGQAIYVDHHDGYRSVYGHLETFAPALLDTVRRTQYARESFAVDLALDSLAFPVRAGDRIGEIGNRGHSFGSHLHFEVREIAGDAPVNPLAFGFRVADTQSPQLRQVRLYELAPDGRELAGRSFPLRADGRGRYLLADTLVVGHPRFGLGVKAFDRQDGMPNWNGIYGARLLADSTELFAFAYDRIPFEDTEYLNALTDYREWVENRSWFYLLWAGTRDAMFWDNTAVSPLDGTLRLQPDRPQALRLEVSDYAGNRSEVALTVVYRPGSAVPPAPAEPHQYFLPVTEASIIDNGALRLELPAGALYRDLYFRYLALDDRSANHLSPTHRLHDTGTPLHGSATLHLRPRRLPPPELRDRVYLGRCGSNGRPVSTGGEWAADGRFGGRIGSFGDYALLLDSVPPTVEIERFSSDLRRAAGFRLRIGDDVAGGGLSYRGTVDGRWILLEYDAKSGRLEHRFTDGEIGRGEHEFRLEVADARGNRTEFTRQFLR